VSLAAQVGPTASRPTDLTSAGLIVASKHTQTAVVRYLVNKNIIVPIIIYCSGKARKVQ